MHLAINSISIHFQSYFSLRFFPWWTDKCRPIARLGVAYVVLSFSNFANSTRISDAILGGLLAAGTAIDQGVKCVSQKITLVVVTTVYSDTLWLKDSWQICLQSFLMKSCGRGEGSNRILQSQRVDFFNETHFLKRVVFFSPVIYLAPLDDEISRLYSLLQ